MEELRKNLFKLCIGESTEIEYDGVGLYAAIPGQPDQYIENTGTTNINIKAIQETMNKALIDIVAMITNKT